MRKGICILSLWLLLAPWTAQAQGNLGGMFSGANLKGVHTYAGVGFADFDVKSPASNFDMDQGIYVYVGGERFINQYGTSVTITLNYMNTKGTAAYDFTTLGGVQYQGNDVKFSSNNYQLGLGLRQRLFPSGWFRPYVEGGGLFGYHQMRYNGNLQNISVVSGSGDPNGFDKEDALTGFGYYGEAGVEVDFSQFYGVRVGARYQNTQTREFDTLAKQKVEFETLIFQFALLLRF